MRALEKNKKGEVVSLPEGKYSVGCKWIFTIKYNSDNFLERSKARLVAKGFTQMCGIDWYIDSIRDLLLNWNICSSRQAKQSESALINCCKFGLTIATIRCEKCISQ